MSDNIEALRAHLFAALEGLKAGTMPIEIAKAMSEVSQTIINSAKVEVEYIKEVGAKESRFISNKQDLPEGITGTTTHKIR